MISTSTDRECNRAGCAKLIPSALAPTQLCLDHFLDEASVRAERAFENCQQGHSLQSDELEWLLSDALAIVKNLEEKAGDPQPQHRDRMLELLLKLANLHEYVAHHSIRLDRPA